MFQLTARERIVLFGVAGLVIVGCCIRYMGLHAKLACAQAGAPGQRFVSAPVRVRINTAAEEHLESLPGIGPALANRIAIYRARHGNFTCAQDLDKVSGIGPKKSAMLAAYIDFE